MSEMSMLGRTVVSELVIGAKITSEGRTALKEPVIVAGVSEGESETLVTTRVTVTLAVDRIVMVVVGSSEVAEVVAPLCGQ
jgi:hypothetical protein